MLKDEESASRQSEAVREEDETEVAGVTTHDASTMTHVEPAFVTSAQPTSMEQH